MLLLIVGIVLGAAFHEFWYDLFFKVKSKINQWTSNYANKEGSENNTGEGSTVEGEVVEPASDSVNAAKS